MGGPARLDPHDAGWQGLEELHKFGALDRLVEDDAPIRGNPVSLKDIRGQIRADRLDGRWAAPLSAVDDTCIMAHREAGGAGAIHLIRFDKERSFNTPAMAEVNMTSTIVVTPETHKTGRAVSDIRFRIAEAIVAFCEERHPGAFDGLDEAQREEDRV